MSLTDDWKAGRCKGWYFVLDIHGGITPDFIYEDTTLRNLARKEVKEVLAPCDYEELKNLQESCKNLEANYKSLQQKQMDNGTTKRNSNETPKKGSSETCVLGKCC